MKSCIFAFALIFAATASAVCIQTTDNSQQRCYTFYAGQHIDVGQVCATVLNNNLLVTYELTDGWTLAETHLWTGANLATMPQTRRGSPQIGHFPYGASYPNGDATAVFSVPITTFNFACPRDNMDIFIAAHAAVEKVNADGSVQGETAWAEGDLFVTKGMWGTFSTATLTCDCGAVVEPPTKVDSCETAFAKSVSQSTCFLTIDEDGDSIGDFNRWGWTNGPFVHGGTTNGGSFPVYAGAAQCDTTKGTLVGSATWSYSADGTVTITVNMTPGTDFVMKETHVYAGYDKLARKKGEFTVAPGQYPIVDEYDTLINGSPVYTFTGLTVDNGIYIVVHTVVCN